MGDSLCDYIKSRVTIEDRGHSTPCWIWQREISATGYGRGEIWSGGRRRRINAHRTSYEAFTGPIPDGLHIDHLCRVRACCNPEHLEAVTARENNLRSIPFRSDVGKSHCVHGHEMAPDNLCKRGQCLACKREHNRKWRRRVAAGLVGAA